MTDREQVRASLSEGQVLVCTLLGEAGEESIDAQIALGCAIRNRVAADGRAEWSAPTMRDVCLKPDQFPCWWGEGLVTQRVYQVAAYLATGQSLGDKSLLSQLRWIADGLQGQAIRDIVHDATHYLTVAAFDSMRAPTWARGAQPVAKYGGYQFFQVAA